MPGQASSPNPQSGRRPIVQSSSRPFNRPHAMLTRPVFRNHQRSWGVHGVCPSLYGCHCAQIGACPSRYAGRSKALHAACSDRSGTALAACRASLPASWHRMSCPGTQAAVHPRDRTNRARACESGHRSCCPPTVCGPTSEFCRQCPLRVRGEDLCQREKSISGGFYLMRARDNVDKTSPELSGQSAFEPLGASLPRQTRALQNGDAPAD